MYNSDNPVIVFLQLLSTDAVFSARDVVSLIGLYNHCEEETKQGEEE